jgi:hypothetical protein
MIETSSTFRAPSLLSPRTANYVAALIRQGDNFDYFKWLQRVREEEGQAKQIPATFTSGKIIAPEIDPPIGTTDCRGAGGRGGRGGGGLGLGLGGWANFSIASPMTDDRMALSFIV